MASEQEIARQAMEPYTSVGFILVNPIATLSVMFLVYGMYIIIFGLSLNVLWRRRESPTSKAYTRWIIALFILSTIYNATIVWSSVEETLFFFNAVKTNNYVPLFKILSGGNRPSEWAARTGLNWFLAIIIGCIFDYLMVYRCYVIWGYSKWILYPFAFVVFVTNMTGLVAYAIETAAYQRQNHALFMRSITIINVLSIITTLYASLLTLLTAGHIWWTVHQVGQITGSRVYTKYKIFVATILESGFLFSATLMVSLVLPWVIDPGHAGIVPLDLNAIAVQMAGIAQTVIIVRIAYGQAVESVQQMVSTLHFAEGVNNLSQQHSIAARSTVNLQQSLAGAEERGTVGRVEAEKPPLNVAGNTV